MWHSWNTSLLGDTSTSNGNNFRSGDAHDYGNFLLASNRLHGQGTLLLVRSFVLHLALISAPMHLHEFPLNQNKGLDDGLDMIRAGKEEKLEQAEK